MSEKITIELDIDEILDQEDKHRIIKEIAERKFAESLHWNDLFGYKPDTVLANMCYETVKMMVAEQMGVDLDKFIREKVVEIIGGMNSYEITGSYDDPESKRSKYPANRIIDDAVKQNEQLLRDRIKKQIEEFELDIKSEYDLSSIIADALTEVVTGRKKGDWKHAF